MLKTYSYILTAVIIVCAFDACRKKNNPAPVISDTIGSPYTVDMCGSHSFHYSESGTSTSHGPYIHTHDTAMSINYLNDTFVTFCGTTFSCDTASTDSTIIFKFKQKNPSVARFDITYNINTQKIDIYKSNYLGPIDPINTFLNYTTEKWGTY